MSDRDPNADLIGYTFTDGAGRDLTVIRTTNWTDTYVEVGCGEYITVRNASLLRRHKELSHV